MRHSSFIILTAGLALISGMTWAGPPEQETSDPPVSDSMEFEIEIPAEETLEETAEPQKALSFEDALAACNDAVDLQTCVDEKTQQTPVESEPELQDMPIDSEKPDCDPELEENCPEIE